MTYLAAWHDIFSSVSSTLSDHTLKASSEFLGPVRVSSAPSEKLIEHVQMMGEIFFLVGARSCEISIMNKILQCWLFFFPFPWRSGCSWFTLQGWPRDLRAMILVCS